MMEIVKSKIDLCLGCNRCVRECPMETANITFMDEDGNIKVKIDHDKCIACGRCISACKHNARYFVDDTERFFDDLAAGVPISVIAAPSISSNIPGFKKLFTYLKQLGVNKIYDVSLGADICIWAHIKYLEERGATPMITQPCPSIVTYCETYHHELKERLSPIHSPMACTSIYMKKYQPDMTDRIAALSPCISKKLEFEETNLAHYNITFIKLMEYLEQRQIVLPDEETEFSHNESGLGSLFPMPGGLKENIEYFIGRKLHISQAEGLYAYERLEKYAQTPDAFRPEIFDVLNCAEGCNFGPASTLDRNVFEIDKLMNNKMKAAEENKKRLHYEEVFRAYSDTLELSHFIREYRDIPVLPPQLTEEDINNAFIALGKTDFEKQNFDCGACGSRTCREMARKIALNVNIPGNCIVKSKEDARTEHERNMLAQAQIAEMEKMHEADELMRIILDATPFGTQIWDETPKVIDCNQATVNLFGLANKQEYLDRFYDLMPEYQPDGQPSKETALKYIRETFKRGYLIVEWTHRAPNGELIPSEMTLVRVAYKDGYLIAAYVSDLREHIRMMRVIEAAQSTTAAMFESNPQINLLFDSDFNIIDCNPTGISYLGFKTKEEAKAGFFRRMEEIIPPYQPGGRPSFTMLDRLRYAAREGIAKFETAVVINGEQLLLDTLFKRIPYGDGFAIVGYVLDVTDMRRREFELISARKQNELQLAKLNLAIKATKIVMWDMEVNKDDPINPNNPFIWSDEFRYMLGFTDEKDFPNLFGSLNERMHPEDREFPAKALERHLMDKTGATPYDIEFRLMKKSGEYAYYHATGETIRDDEGAPVHVAGTLMDITETKNILFDTDRQRIEAEAASKAKSVFLSTMSHEIRTPMNAIIGMTTIGQLSKEAHKKDDALNKIETASKHLLGIINDILDISKIEADKFELSPVSFDFEKMLQKVAGVVNLKVDERRQKFYINIGKDLPDTLIGDDQRLSQVIANLLSNAVKFTPEGGTIHLDSQLIAEENGLCRIQISIEDSGIGISEEQQARLFQSFEQAETGTSRKYGGTGLGLSISKRIVELMDGEIWVESALNQGSKFIFTVLLRRGASVKKQLLAAGVNWGNLRIFAVDDEPEIREFFLAVSENLGISCVVAASAEEAVEVLSQTDNFDIHFIDWILPGKNGGELARHIQEKATGQSIVIIFSSTDWSLIEEEARTAGVEKFLPKPLFPSVIVDTINEFIGVDHRQEQEYKTGYTDDFAGCSLLLAEDVEINREIILTLLEPMRLTVECAENGAQALQMFRTAPDKYDMIFMDIQMPEMDGYEATRAIRALAANRAKTVPIIAMTANVFREDVEMCFDAGMNGHVGKPLDFNEVIRQLRRYLKKGQAK